MAKAQSPSAGKRAGGVLLMLLGVALIGYGTHYLAKNGNCSSTGYVSYGPVPKCSGGEALYILSTFFLGPALAVAGWLFAQIDGVLWPAVCVSAGIGLIALHLDAAPGTQSFGVATGLIFFALAVLSVVLTVRKRRRPKPAVHGPAGLPGAPVLSMPAGNPPASGGPQPGGPQFGAPHPGNAGPAGHARPGPARPDRQARATARQRRAHQRGVRGTEGQAARRDVAGRADSPGSMMRPPRDTRSRYLSGRDLAHRILFRALRTDPAGLVPPRRPPAREPPPAGAPAPATT